MPERFERWWRYPFAVAGPISVACWGLVALAGVLGALLLRPSLAPLPGTMAIAAGYLTIRRARKRFRARRDIAPYPWNVPRRLRLEFAGAVVAIAALTVVTSFRWNPAWLWVLGVAGLLGLEFDRRQTWARAGYPGDPRWRTDWDPEADPAYEGQAVLPLLAKDYAEAKRLLECAVALKPDDAFVLYNLACTEALTGEPDAALGHLQKATAGNGYYLKLAQKDKDLATIRDDPRFPR